MVRDTSWLRLDLDEAFDSMLGLPAGRLVLLSVRNSSKLALRFSTISPPPAMTTGLIRSRKKGSLETLSCGEAALVMLRSRAIPKVPALLLLPRPAYLPYPSWPVPAAGPFLRGLSLVSKVAISGVVFARLPKRPKRGFELVTLGLGVRDGGTPRRGSC